MNAPTIVVFPDKALTAEGIAQRLVCFLVERQSSVSPVHISLTGGSLGIEPWQHVAANPLAGAVDWSGVHAWWGDERFKPHGDAERNDTEVIPILHDLGMPTQNIHAIPGPGDRGPDGQSITTPDDAAAAYAAELTAWAQDSVPAPLWELSMLGIGPDGHVASLFPGHTTLTRTDVAAVGEDDSPKPPPQRVSLTYPLLNHAKELWFVAAGADKAQAVQRNLSCDNPTRTPSAGVRGLNRTLFLIDESLAKGLSLTVDKQ